MITGKGVYIHRGADWRTFMVIYVRRVRTDNMQRKAFFDVIYQDGSRYYIGDKDSVSNMSSLFKQAKPIHTDDCEEIFASLFEESMPDQLMGRPDE